jgi:hypothetical protein
MSELGISFIEENGAGPGCIFENRVWRLKANNPIGCDKLRYAQCNGNRQIDNRLRRVSAIRHPGCHSGHQ